MAATNIRGEQIKDASVSLTADVTGTLPVGNGGTGSTTLTLNNVLLGNGTGGLQAAAPSTAGNLLRSDGTTWASGAPVRVNSTASSATPAINVDTTDQFNVTALAAAITSMTSGLTGTPRDGQKLIVRIKDNGTARTIAWGTSWQSSDNAALITTTVVGKTHILGFIYDSVVAKWVCVAVNSY